MVSTDQSVGKVCTPARYLVNVGMPIEVGGRERMLTESMTPAAREKRDEIIRAAAVLFDTEGYARTSMVEIARACGLSKPTLYHYFDRKDAILFEIHDRLMDLLLDQLAARMADGERPAIEILRDAVHDVLATFVTHPGYARAFMEAYRELPAPLQARVAGKRDQYAEAFEALIKQAQDADELRPMDLRLTRLSVLGMVSWTYHWLNPQGSLKSDDIATFMWDLVLNGMQRRG
jgi:TetR/AcrR family transcriptional regulator, cholesterol catabolism regulator